MDLSKEVITALDDAKKHEIAAALDAATVIKAHPWLFCAMTFIGFGLGLFLGHPL